ncbi:MAG: hypothetical protein Q9185_000570 [Variospora sp. 1 TL-2023]
MIPYAYGLRVFDKVYLDTTFALDENPYRIFPTKAQGISELLTKVSKFPESTVFHLSAWTLGYEDVMVALAVHLNTQMHVDDYKFRLYGSLSSSSGGQPAMLEGAALCGFRVGNRDQSGCLTQDDSVRLHGCEHGRCSALEKSRNVVWITPLISRSKEGDVRELGAGGGGGDLVQNHELELAGPETGQRLIELCKSHIQDTNVLRLIDRLVRDALYSRKMTIDLNVLGRSLREDAVPLDRFACLLGHVANREDSLPDSSMSVSSPLHCRPWLLGDSPTHLQFPYSRHSSYKETCHLLSVIKSMDVWPCVTNEESWAGKISIKTLFGRLSSGTSFSYDDEMRLKSNKDQARALDYNSPQRLYVRKRRTSPAPSTEPLSANLDPARNFAAFDQLEWTDSFELEATAASPRPAKRQIAARANTRKRIQYINRSLQQSSAVRADPLLCTSFSVWVKHLDDKVKPYDILEDESADDVGGSSSRGKEIAILETTTDAVSSWNNGLPAIRHNQPWESLHDTYQHKLTNEKDSIEQMSTHRSIRTSSKGHGIEGSTQLIPIQLSATSGSEGNDNAELGNEIRTSTEPGSSNATHRPAGDSVFGSQDLVFAGTPREKGPNQSRIRYREEIYEMVKSDEGFAWGRDWGLFSAATGNNDGDSEEL